jgi:hypothetical protein
MCGINGLVMLKGQRTQEMLAAIRYVYDVALGETQDRGHHATGLIRMERSGEYGFHKAALAAKLMTTYDSDYDGIVEGLDDESASIVSHTRWYTKGKPEVYENNHPFDIGNVVGVHNGTVANDDDLFKKNTENFTRIAEVDSEIIYQLINHHNKEGITFDGLKEALEKSLLRGVFALAFVHKNQPNLVHIVKQDRPMDFVLWEEAGVVFFNSDKKYLHEAFDSLRRVQKRLNTGWSGITLTEYELKSDKYMTINADAETFAEVFSEPQSLFLTSTATKTTYTASTYRGAGTGGGTTAGNGSTNITHITAADSIGRTIEGELDTVSGEVVIFTSSQISALTEDDGSAMGDDEEANWCVECGGELEEHEVHAAFNEGAKESKTFYCTDCHKTALDGVFAG